MAAAADDGDAKSGRTQLDAKSQGCAAPSAEKSAVTRARETLIVRVGTLFKALDGQQLADLKETGMEMLKQTPIEKLLTLEYATLAGSGIPDECLSILKDMILPTWNDSMIMDDAVRYMMSMVLVEMLSDAAQQARTMMKCEQLKEMLNKGIMGRVCNKPNCNDPACPNRGDNGPLGIHDMTNCKITGCETCRTAVVPK